MTLLNLVFAALVSGAGRAIDPVAVVSKVAVSVADDPSLELLLQASMQGIAARKRNDFFIGLFICFSIVMKLS
jgi:hypothetical protein